MNFRLPFQISRVSAICQSSSPLNSISKFTPIYGSHVKNTKQDKQDRAHRTRLITTKCSYKKFHSPFNVFQQKAFLHDLAKTEQAVKQRVRELQCCDWPCNEEPLELAFRQTCKVDCMKCMDRKPYLAPPLVRPPKFYDDTQCLFEHKCNPDLGNINPPRMDDFCCCQYEKKQLPYLPSPIKCFPCIDVLKKPLLAPRLVPPPKWYDPEKMKWDHGICKDPPCVRRDDGLQTIAKELPTIPLSNCVQTVCFRPLTAPVLRRPSLRYNPECIPYAHTTCPAIDEAPRRDECLMEPVCKELPVLPTSYYIPGEQPPPTKCPELRRPLARYNPMEMEYKHEYPTSPCDTPSLRRDNNNNIISVTLTRKKLPPLHGDNVCQPCIDYRPLTAPPLGRPKLFQRNLNEEQKRSHCYEEKPIRRDGQIRICRKCLPKVPMARCSRPCMDIFTPCTTPNYLPPQKLYDDSKCSYRHKYTPQIGDDPPPRMDDYCLRVARKPLPKAPCSPHCRPSPDYPKTSPILCRPNKWYDDTKLKYQHPECPEDPCETIPRADKVTGYRDEVKELQPFKALKCKVCQQYFPFKAPKLCRPHARYDDTCMLYDHKHCLPPCDGSVFRRDHFLWEGPKKLPPIRCGTLCCEKCQQGYPSVAPPLNGPKKLYDFPQDPIRAREFPPECPPRRDDIFCWRPRRKRLPSFKDCCNQSCCFSTFSWVSSKKDSMISKSIGGKKKAQLKQENNTNNKNMKNKDSEALKPILKEKNSNDQYYIVKEPTWKCIDVTNEKKPRKIYDYSIEKWLRRGAEYLINSTPNAKSKSNINMKKRSKSNISSQPEYTCKYCSETRCMTPLKFTGFDNSQTNNFLFIKKDNKLQPLKVGSAFKSKVTSSKAETCIPKTVKFNEEQLAAKSTASKAVAPKQSNKPFMISSIIQEHINHLPLTYKMRTNNFVLNLNNRMRSTLFQKISNFFKNREKAARKAIKNKPSTTTQQKDTTASNKEFIDNICEKYNVEFDKSNTERNNNKAYFVQKFKNKNAKTETDKNAISCSSKTNTKIKSKKNEQPTKKVPKSILKQIKIKTDQIRNFSTQNQAKGRPLNYKHIDISDDYIGKIYKVKLKKIGVKNLMLEKNDPEKRDEEPHTICYICKVVPRYQPIIQEEAPDIENVKINYYREKRNTIE